MTNEFMSPYQVQKVLDGVIKNLTPKRPLWLSTFVQDGGTVEKDTINFDTELATKNVMGHFWGAEIDATPIKHQGFGHVEMYLGYTKEAVHLETNYDTLNKRMLGDPLGVVDIIQNQKTRLTMDFVKAEERIQNLFEYTARDIFLYGGYVAQSEAHPTMVYDFGRSVVSTAADLTDNTVLCSSTNLTTSAVTSPWGTTILPIVTTSGGFTQGDKAWSKTNVDSGKATPWLDVLRMVMTCQEWDRAEAISMSADAYAIFNYDIEKNYTAAASLTEWTLNAIARDVLPILRSYDGLDYMRSIPLGNGMSLPIFVYKGIYHDRSTGVRTAYMPSGWVNVIPGTPIIKKYGRIKHPKALWQAMPRWINMWRNEKAGTEEYEIHSSFAMGHSVVNALISWKVI